MTDIPQDIEKAAAAVYEQLGRTPISWEPIARAIMAERDRCAKVAEASDDEELKINGKTKWTGYAIAAAIRKRQP